jgi:hypothetical protein
MIPGVYTVLGSDQEKRVGMFAINLDTHESDLSYLDDGLDEGAIIGEIKGRLGQPPVVSYIADPGLLASSPGGGTRGRELWHALLVVVLLIGLFEPWLANQISSRLYARQPATPVVPGPQPLRVIEQPDRPAEVAR